MAKAEKRERSLFGKIILGIGLAWLALVLFGIALILFQVVTSLGWKDRPIKGEAERMEIAETDFLMPEMAAFIEKHSQTGMRDYDDAYETCWFDSVEELFAVLPYQDETCRQDAKELFWQLDAKEEDHHSLKQLLGDNMTVYCVDFLLPLGSEDVRSAYWQSCYRYNYYIVVDSRGNGRAKLICYRMEY